MLKNIVIAGMLVLASSAQADWEECEGFVEESTVTVATKAFVGIGTTPYMKVVATPREARTSEGEACFRFDADILVQVPVAQGAPRKEEAKAMATGKRAGNSLASRIKKWQQSRVHLGKPAPYSLEDMAKHIEEEWKTLR